MQRGGDEKHEREKKKRKAEGLKNENWEMRKELNSVSINRKGSFRNPGSWEKKRKGKKVGVKQKDVKRYSGFCMEEKGYGRRRGGKSEKRRG